MTKPSIANLERLIRDIVLPFYDVERSVPIRSKAGRFENDAEHSWSLALFASALAPHVDPSLDVGRVCQFAVVHDLVEVHAGDTSNFAPKNELDSKEVREAEALEKLKTQLASLPWITETIQQYEAQDTAEARFVKSADKIIVLLFDLIDEGKFYHENKMSFERFEADLQVHRQKASKHDGAYEYYQEIRAVLAAHPEYFYKSE